MEDLSNKASKTATEDINNPNFYESIHNEIERDLARMKKNIDVMMDLRITVAELEVEAARLLHAEVWFNFIEAQNIEEQNNTDYYQSAVESNSNDNMEY